jgi:hypothetical protein
MRLIAELTEAQRIQRLLAFLQEHNDHWKRPLGTPPIGQYRLIFRGGDGQPVVFMEWRKGWMSVSGPTATEPPQSGIVSQPAPGQPLVRGLSTQDEEQLIGILTVPPPD